MNFSAGILVAALTASASFSAAAQAGAGLSLALSSPSLASAVQVAPASQALGSLGASATLIVRSIETVTKPGVGEPVTVVSLGVNGGSRELASAAIQLMLAPHFIGQLAVHQSVTALKRPGGYAFSDGRETFAYVPDEETRSMLYHRKRF